MNLLVYLVYGRDKSFEMQSMKVFRHINFLMALLGMHGYMNTPEPVTLIKEFYTLEHMSTTSSQMTRLWRFTFLLMVTMEMCIQANIPMCPGRHVGLCYGV